MNNSKIGRIAAIVMIAGCLTYFGYRSLGKRAIQTKIETADASASLQVYTTTDLDGYNGTDPDKPICIALDGYVYDVTAGRDFYQPGGDYHYLAGRDSSEDLKIFGGDIIKKKYPIIGLYR